MAKLKNPKSLEVNEKVSTAAMIVNKDHVEIQKIIKKFINMEIIKETQNQVIKGQLIPMY